MGNVWGPEHHNWKGDKASYRALHRRVNRRRGRANTHRCWRCLERGTRKSARYWARIHTENGLDPYADYVPLCAKCHCNYDNAELYERKRTGATTPNGVCGKGHVLDEKTAYWYVRKSGTLKHVCKQCQADKRHARREVRRAAR